MTVRYEDKTCPRCGARFECGAGSPLPCQCAGVALSPEESAYVTGRYADCLCVQCLRSLKTEREIQP